MRVIKFITNVKKKTLLCNYNLDVLDVLHYKALLVA